MPKKLLPILMICAMCVLALAVNNAALAEDDSDMGITTMEKPTPSVMTLSAMAEDTVLPLAGKKVLLTGIQHVGSTGERLTALGAIVTTVTPTDLTDALLCDNELLWIGLDGADDVYNAGNMGIVLAYVQGGGGLIIEQPNISGPIEGLTGEYAWYIDGAGYQEPCERRILDPNHPLVVGLDAEQMPPAYDNVGPIGSAWTVLVLDGDDDQSLAFAQMGLGMIVIEMGNTTTYSCVCGICQYDEMIIRMVEYVAGGCSVDADDDGYYDYEDCNDNDGSVYPGAPQLCDGINNDCDSVEPLYPQVPDDEIDFDGDGYTGCSGDCNESDASINPDAYELPGNTVDENCDGSLGECVENPEEHGLYVACVVHELKKLRDAGAITQDQFKELVKQAAHSDIGKK